MLVSQIQQGNSVAFTTLVRKYRERIFSVIYNLTSNAADANDLTQDVFIKALNSIDKFRKDASVFTWLYRIAVNLTFSFLRKNKKNAALSLNELEENGFTPEQQDAIPIEDGGDRKFFLSELQKNLNEALKKLSNDHRVVFVLFEIDGLSHEEISKIVGVSVGTVRSRLHYAKQQLRVFLKDFI